MWKRKLILGIRSYDDPEEQLDHLKAAGFDGFFVVWKKDMKLQSICSRASELGLTFHSVHAPNKHIHLLWKEDGGEGAEEALAELLQCLHETAEAGVPIMVVHAFIGFQDHTPTETGIRNFGRLFSEAEKLGITIALENTEGEEYLDALMKAFRPSPALGFCWDTGHEMCYNHSRDMVTPYGDKLVATHLNDNLGIRDFDGNTTPQDDLHLLPFDGIGDWENIVDRLNRIGYDRPLVFELNRKSKTGRHDNDRYERMSTDEYYARAYAAACRVAALMERRKRLMAGR